MWWVKKTSVFQAGNQVRRHSLGEKQLYTFAYTPVIILWFDIHIEVFLQPNPHPFLLAKGDLILCYHIVLLVIISLSDFLPLNWTSSYIDKASHEHAWSLGHKHWNDCCCHPLSQQTFFSKIPVNLFLLHFMVKLTFLSLSFIQAASVNAFLF